MQDTFQWLLLNNSSNTTFIILILSYDFSSYRIKNIFKDFLIFWYFSSYELLLKIAFQSIHCHFAFIKLKIQSSLKLFHKKVFIKIMKQTICQKITVTGRERKLVRLQDWEIAKLDFLLFYCFKPIITFFSEITWRRPTTSLKISLLLFNILLKF